LSRAACVSPERVLAAAAVEFAARGFAGTSVDRSPAAPRVNNVLALAADGRNARS
jgi:hypothetical protein